MPAAEVKKAVDAGDDTRLNPRPPLRIGRMACSQPLVVSGLRHVAYTTDG